MNQRQVQYTVQEAFFNSVFFWFAFVLIFPLITMRLFAEEFKLGTIEPLMTAPVRDWQVVLSKFFGALIFYLILWIPPAFYFVIFQYDHWTTRCPFRRSILGFVFDAFAARHVLSLDRLPRIRSDQKPDHCRDHFFLRDYAAVLSWAGSVHSSRRQLGDARPARLLLRHRAHGNIFARRDRYAADRFLPEHDSRDAGAHLSGIPITQMEAVTNG